MKLSTIALSSCSGCHMALLSLGRELFDLLGEHEIAFSPILMDEKNPVDCDVALIEGSVRNDENLELLKEMRHKSKILIAFGTCAAFGGIPGLGSAYPTLELLIKAYGENYAPENTPVLEQRVSPIDDFVEVDYYLPGCPPAPQLIKEALSQLLAGEKPRRYDLPVCAECDRVARQRVQPEFKRIADQVPLRGECLLSQGYVCLGSVSRSGCDAVCTAAGVPCMGCRGPIDRVLTEPTHGMLHDLTRRISHFTGKSEKDVAKKLPDQLHNLYSYTLSVPEMRSKDAEGISGLINRIKV